MQNQSCIMIIFVNPLTKILFIEEITILWMVHE